MLNCATGFSSPSPPIVFQEEMPENAERGLVVAAFASRTNVLSTPLPCNRAVTFSESDNSTSSRAITIDSASGKPAWVSVSLIIISLFTDCLLALVL
ncbi:unnamed protein product [Dibothriocephalus latus]|uniref:Uncharacterized protein n=1 Tax=Dibothriocephalus latus TaxID=60516 RepID=A0A3P7RL18_DIBLA|nr:unnamed protein product [Dibothriocephalus latus]